MSVKYAKKAFIFDIYSLCQSYIMKLSDKLDSGSNNFLRRSNIFSTRGLKLRFANLALAGSLILSRITKTALYVARLFVSVLIILIAFFLPYPEAFLF